MHIFMSFFVMEQYAMEAKTWLVYSLMQSFV